MYYLSCSSDVYQSSDTVVQHPNNSVVAPQCTSIKHGVHGKRMKDVSIDTQTSAVIPRKNMKTTWLVLQINTKVTVSDAFKVLQKDESLYYRFA